MPERIRMSRQHPWRAEHPDAVIVDRRTKWGNPWRIVRTNITGTPEWAVMCGGVRWSYWLRYYDAATYAVDNYRVAVSLGASPLGLFRTAREVRAELAGKDVACWCPLDQPCHGDVLLSIAAGEMP